MPVNVNANLSRSTSEIAQLETIMRNRVMPDLATKSGLPAGSRILVNCRLNETGQKEPSPIWCGWVEQPASEFNPIPGDHLSPVYREAYTQHGKVVGRKYPDDRAKEKKKDSRPNTKKPDPFDRDATSGYKWRRFVCIKAGGRKAGTLTVGFCG